MRQCTLLLVIMLTVFCTHAQNKITIKQGTLLTYSVSVNGQTFPMFIQMDSLTKDYCGLSWNFENARSGRFVMRGASLDSARLGYWNQPINGEELELPPSQGLLMFSRMLFYSLQKNGRAKFDEYSIAIKPPPADRLFKWSNSLTDVLYMEGESGAKIWVLNNPYTPLILKVEGNPFGVDVELTGVQ